MNNPLDLLPIERPLESTEPWPDDTYFYNNVVSKLIPDVIKLETTGIPIDLEKVKQVEDTVNNVLKDIKDILKDNKFIEQYLCTKYLKESDKALGEMKTKTTEDFLVAFDVKKKAHRSAVVNYWLKNNGHEDMVMDEWSIKDLQMCNQIVGSKFLTDILAKNIQGYMFPFIDEAMEELANEKARIYNLNRLSIYENKMRKKKNELAFNPGSSLQKQEFFEMLGIESDSETAKGAQQWNRAALEQLNKYLDTLIESKGDN